MEKNGTTLQKCVLGDKMKRFDSYEDDDGFYDAGFPGSSLGGGEGYGLSLTGKWDIAENFSARARVACARAGAPSLSPIIAAIMIEKHARAVMAFIDGAIPIDAIHSLKK